MKHPFRKETVAGLISVSCAALLGCKPSPPPPSASDPEKKEQPIAAAVAVAVVNITKADVEKAMLAGDEAEANRLMKLYEAQQAELDSKSPLLSGNPEKVAFEFVRHYLANTDMSSISELLFPKPNLQSVDDLPLTLKDFREVQNRGFGVKWEIKEIKLNPGRRIDIKKLQGSDDANGIDSRCFLVVAVVCRPPGQPDWQSQTAGYHMLRRANKWYVSLHYPQ